MPNAELLEGGMNLRQVLECGGPPPLFVGQAIPTALRKRQRTGALQDAFAAIILLCRLARLVSGLRISGI